MEFSQNNNLANNEFHYEASFFNAFIKRISETLNLYYLDRKSFDKDIHMFISDLQNMSFDYLSDLKQILLNFLKNLFVEDIPYKIIIFEFKKIIKISIEKFNII